MKRKPSFLFLLRSSLLLVILTSAGPPVFCQQPGSVFDHISTANGLSSNGVTDVIQDQQGFYWIATHNGLNRFDGTNFKIFYNNPDDSNSLIHNHCNALVEDSEGNIWIATMKGISRFNKKQNRFSNYIFRNERIEFDNLNRVFELLKDEDGNIWAVGVMLMKYDIKNKLWIDYSKQTPFNSFENLNEIKHADYDAQRKAIWIATYSRIFLLFTANAEVYHAENNPLKWKIFTTVNPWRPRADSKGRIWFHDAEKENISFFSPATNTINSVATTTRGIHQLQTDEKNRLWVFFWKGPAAVYDHETGIWDSSLFVRSYPGSIINPNGSNLYVDRDHNYWITSNYGISVLNSREQYFKYYRLNDIMNNADDAEFEIDAIAESSDQHLLVASSYGLYRYDLINNNFKQIYTPVFAVFQQNDSLLWLSVSGRIIRYNYKTKRVESSLQVASRCNYFIQDNEKRIWANMWDDGLYCFDSSGLLLAHLLPDSNRTASLKVKSLIAFEPGRQPGIFWIGYNSGQGFSRFDSRQKTFEHYRIKLAGSNEIVSNTITSIFEAAGGNLFLGTYGGGIYYFDLAENQFTGYLQSDGLHSNFINEIFADKHENLWISTSAGLNYFNRKGNQIIPLPVDMASLSNDFIPNGYKTKSGQLFFFSQNNLVAVDPEKFNIDTRSNLPLMVSTLKIFDDEIPFSASNGKLSLSYKQNFFSFEFSLLKTNPTLPVQYAYQLKGFDKTWNHVFNRNTVNYTNVPPGRYTFLLKATNQAGQWVYEAKPIDIIISPPFWKTVWFWMIAGLLVISSLYWFYRYRLNRLKMVYEVRNKISRDLHDDIGATLSSLQIYGDIAEKTFKENPSRAMDMIRKISSQSKTVMENMNDIVWSMKTNTAATTTLEAKVKNYGVELLSDKNISFQYQIDPAAEQILQSVLARKNTLLIIKEAMNNIAKYSKASEASLVIEIEGKSISVRLTDNGCGFDMDQPSSGNGLRNMQQRVQELKGRLIIRSAPRQGTSITAIFANDAISGKGW